MSSPALICLDGSELALQAAVAGLEVLRPDAALKLVAVIAEPDPTLVTGGGDSPIQVIDVGGRVDLASDDGSVRVEGATRLQFDAWGKVCLHRDYFDLGAMLYEQLPLLGPVVRVIKGRLGT